MALEWKNIDLQAGVIHVERAYDDKAKEFIPTKNRETRRVPNRLRGNPRRHEHQHLAPLARSAIRSRCIHR
jgi:hypothetical protein